MTPQPAAAAVSSPSLSSSGEEEFTKRIVSIAIAHIIKEVTASQTDIAITRTEARCLDVLVHCTDLFLARLARQCQHWARQGGRRTPGSLDVILGCGIGLGGGPTQPQSMDGSEGYVQPALFTLLDYGKTITSSSSAQGANRFPRLLPGTYPIPPSLASSTSSHITTGDHQVPPSPFPTSPSKRKASNLTGSLPGKRKRLEKYLYPAQNASEDFVLMDLPDKSDYLGSLLQPASATATDENHTQTSYERALASAHQPNAITLIPPEKTLQLIHAASTLAMHQVTHPAILQPSLISSMTDAALPWIPEWMGSVAHAASSLPPAWSVPKRKKDKEMHELMMMKLGGEISTIPEDGEEDDGDEGDEDEDRATAPTVNPSSSGLQGLGIRVPSETDGHSTHVVQNQKLQEDIKMVMEVEEF